MQTVTENSLKPTVKTALLWELLIPDNCFNEAAERCQEKGREDFAIYEGTRVHGYQMSLCVITSIFNEAIKLVHFDGTLLHIFMKDRLPQNHVLLLKRLFESKMYLPDKVMNDILANNQALFTTREQDGSNVVETSYMGLTSYEGPTDYTDIKDQLIANDIFERAGNVALVYNVDSLRETVYENARYDEIGILFIGGTERVIDTLMFSRELQKDPIKRKATVAIAERSYRENVLRPKTSARTSPTQVAVESRKALKEIKDTVPEFNTLKKLKKAAKGK